MAQRRTVTISRYSDGITSVPSSARFFAAHSGAISRASSLSIVQVALEVGYESESAFQRAFKEAVGATPGGWRRRARGAVG